MAFFIQKTVFDPDSTEYPKGRQAQAFTHIHEDESLDQHRHLVGGVSRYLNPQTSWGIVLGDHIHEDVRGR